VADTPGKLTVSGVREAWPEVVAEVRRQPRGKVIGPMIADAVVRSLDGDTVVLLHQHDWAAARITQESALVTNALYETLGGRWQIRCEVGGVEGGDPSRGPARREAPPRARNDSSHEPGPRATTSAAPRVATGAQQAHAASARPPQARRQETESAGSSDDDWPEPVRPGSASPAVAPPPVDDEEEDWPEVRQIGVPPVTAGGAAPSGDGSAADTPARSDARAAVSGHASGPVSGDASGHASGHVAGDASGHVAGPGSGHAADRAAQDAPGEPSGGAAGGPVGSSGGAPVVEVAPDRNGSQIGQERAEGPSAAAPGGVPSAPATGSAGAAAAARAARNAGPGSGLAAARAAVAGARAAASARQGGARPVAPPAAPGAPSAVWSDGSPAEEAPYDPEFDGPPRGEGSGYEGFDPGDEPLDDVIDEKTARESSEQQAMRLLQEVLGAEKIGES
jgi:DNA polymerase-3 subunit gamma/tau